MIEHKTVPHQRITRKSTVLDLAMNNKALVILLLFCVVLSLTTDTFLTPTNLLNVVRQVCVSIILGTGFTVILSTGSLDLSVGAMLGLIGVITANLSKMAGVPFFLVIIVGILVGMGLGMVNGVVSDKFAIPAFIVTLATKNIFTGSTYLITHNKPVIDLPDPYVFLGQGYLGPIPLAIVVMVIIVILGYLLLNKTTLGRHCLAVGGNAEAARVSGVNITKTRIMAYMWMGICAGIAALLYTGRSASAQINAGSGMEMDIIAGVVIGGTTIGGGSGKVVGTVMGCLMVQVINNGMTLLGLDSNWQIVMKGLLILVAVVLDIQGEKLVKARMIRAVRRS